MSDQSGVCFCTCPGCDDCWKKSGEWVPYGPETLIHVPPRPDVQQSVPPLKTYLTRTR